MVLLDLAIYLQHVLFHAVPALWRLHRMHHADLEFDVTTGVRFHPIEILLSMVIKLGVVAALGAPAVAVLIFEVLLNATSMFNHGNVRLPPRLDRVLRWIVVTPDMHRVHHSIVPRETNSNFGFNLPWWDRLFGTYRAQPAAGHEGMTIGIEQFRDPARAPARPHAARSRSAAMTAAIRSDGGSRPNDSARRRSRAFCSGLSSQARRSGSSFNRDRLDPALLETAVRDLGPWAPLAHIALFALGTLLFVPGAIFGLAGGALFGPLWGQPSICRAQRSARPRPSWSRATLRQTG